MQNLENKDSELLVKLTCYEPAGHEVGWTEPEFLQHMLTIGMTGSGKTSQIRRIIHQLIHHQASDPERRVGLCILDGKVDDTVAHVQEMARQAHRQEDIATMGPGGDYALDLFGSLRTLADVDRTTRRLAFGSHSMGQENTFWDEFRYALLDAALTLLVINQVPVEFASALEFLHRLFFVAQAGDERLKQVEARAQEYLRWAPAAARRKVRQALELLTNWRTMEGRTKSTVQATLMNVIRPLVSLSASPCFEPHGRGYFALDRVVQDGRIGIVSLNALAEPGLAGLLFKLAKEEFFRAVQARGAESHRLCGLVADEWPLIVTPEDAEQLTLVLEKVQVPRALFGGVINRTEFLADRMGKTAADRIVQPPQRAPEIQKYFRDLPESALQVQSQGKDHF